MNKAITILIAIVVGLIIGLLLSYGFTFVVEHHEQFRNFSLAIFGLVSVVLFAWRSSSLYQTAKQDGKKVDLQIKSSDQESFNSALNLLAKDSLTLKVGGVFALEKLAIDNSEYAKMVTDILSNHFNSNINDGWSKDLKAVVEALSVISGHYYQMYTSGGITWSVVVDLSDNDFLNYFFEDTEFINFDFSRANLQQFEFKGCSFTCCKFDEALVNKECFEQLCTVDEITKSSLPKDIVDTLNKNEDPMEDEFKKKDYKNLSNP